MLYDIFINVYSLYDQTNIIYAKGKINLIDNKGVETNLRSE